MEGTSQNSMPDIADLYQTHRSASDKTDFRRQKHWSRIEQSKRKE